jgi:hypothetical protein
MARTYWIGGGTGGGKTTVARALVTRYDLRLFPIDAFWYAYLSGRERKSPDDQWLRTPPEVQADEFEADSHEMHLRALVELAHLPPMPTLVEGPQVQPDLVPDGDRAVFLIPTPEFQRSVLQPRLMPSSDPALALKHRLVKDRIYADRIAERVRAHGFPVIEVDGTRDLVEEVAELLRIEHEPIDLVAARRWENERVAANLRAWLSSPEAPLEPLGALPFACECGTPGCTERVMLTLDEFFAGAVRSAH